VKVAELGELGLIDLINRIVSGSRSNQPSWQQLVLGIGDDAAAWQADSSVHLVTTDSLIQDVHFSLATAAWDDLGWKALAVNLSDIAAMGGVPQYALVALAVPAETDVASVTDLYHGMLEMAQQSGVAIVGGDTDCAPAVMINVTVIGKTARREYMLTRSAARAGDKIAVTGYVGSAAAGLKMLKERLRFDPAAMAFLRRAFWRPCPRVTEGQQLLQEGVRTAIDISDGLVADLTHICRTSRVGARVDIDRVPVAPAVIANFGNKALELALSGGEDYELLFTASAETIDKVKRAVKCPITVIGDIIASDIMGVTLVDSEGKPFQLTKDGWEHFTA